MGSVLDRTEEIRQEQEGSPRKAYCSEKKLATHQDKGMIIMAEKLLERTYNVPLRKEWLKVPRYKRAKKASVALQQFLEKHMKVERVIIGKFLNEEVWKHGMRNPPHHVKVNVIKKDDVCKAELFGKELKFEEKKDKEAKKEGKGKLADLKEQLTDKIKKTDKEAKEESSEETKKAKKE